MFNFKPIKPGTYDVNAMRSKIRALLDEEGKIDKRLMQTTVENWQDPPGFETTITMGADAIADTHPTGGDHQKKKWYWLEGGTRVRYARMSPDWESKTAPGTLRSGPGQGQVVARGRRAGAQPGIQARGWIPIIVKMRRGPFQARARQVLGNVKATVRPSQ